MIKVLPNVWTILTIEERYPFQTVSLLLLIMKRQNIQGSVRQNHSFLAYLERCFLSWIILCHKKKFRIITLRQPKSNSITLRIITHLHLLICLTQSTMIWAYWRYQFSQFQYNIILIAQTICCSFLSQTLVYFYNCIFYKNHAYFRTGYLDRLPLFIFWYVVSTVHIHSNLDHVLCGILKTPTVSRTVIYFDSDFICLFYHHKSTNIE